MAAAELDEASSLKSQVRRGGLLNKAAVVSSSAHTDAAPEAGASPIANEATTAVSAPDGDEVIGGQRQSTSGSLAI